MSNRLWILSRAGEFNKHRELDTFCSSLCYPSSGTRLKLPNYLKIESLLWWQREACLPLLCGKTPRTFVGITVLTHSAVTHGELQTETDKLWVLYHTKWPTRELPTTCHSSSRERLPTTTGSCVPWCASIHIHIKWRRKEKCLWISVEIVHFVHVHAHWDTHVHSTDT